MKKTTLSLFLFLLVAIAPSVAQTDFYAGKWEIQVLNSPIGNVRFHTNLVRKDGKLTGELSDADDASKPKRAITKVVESDKGMEIFFESSQAGEVSTKLEKVDADNLKGTTSGYETTATRLKEATSSDFFASKWEITVFETPNGDATFTTELTRKNGKLTGVLKNDQLPEPIPLDDVEEPSKTTIVLSFKAQGYDLKLDLEKVDDDNLKGMLIGQFKAIGKRVK